MKRTNHLSQQQQLAKHEKERLFALTLFERRARAKGFKRVAGIDEAGRGPLAGPVVAALALIPEGLYFDGINDSKLLTVKKRRSLFDILRDHPLVEWSYSVVDVAIIDEINILQATRLAMKRAVEQLIVAPDYLLIDALCIDLTIDQEKIIHGDQLSQSIAAASILAKEVRDELMREYHTLYPEYGFDAHKGYGTERHLEALAKYGPTPVHRRTFAPVEAVYREGEKISL